MPHTVFSGEYLHYHHLEGIRTITVVSAHDDLIFTCRHF